MKLRRKVLVLGRGALGGALTDRLSRCADVTGIDSRRPLFKENVFDGIIAATKCHDLDDAFASLKGRITSPRIMFLQNGLFSLTKIQKLFPNAGLVRAVTTSAAERSPTRSFFHYQGEFLLAPEGNRYEAARWFGCLFQDADLRTRMFSDSSRIVWSKLIFSAVMNPLPVMTGKGYDILKKDPLTWELARQAVEEGRAVARALGIRLAFDPLTLIARVRHGNLKGIAHRGSIAQDMAAGRPTEIDVITGALIHEARRQGITTPALTLIYKKSKEAGA